MHSRALPAAGLALVAVTLAAPLAHAQPVVPGFTVETYATVPGPVGLSFAADGTLFTGRDVPGTTGGDTVKIHRIPPGGGAGVEYGESGIPDPDGVLVDLDGSISGTAGAVIVTGQVTGLPMGQIVAVLLDQSIVTVFGPTALLSNPNYLERGDAGLLISDSDLNQVLAFTPPGPPAVLIPTTSAPTYIAVAGPNHVLVSHADGIIRRYDSNGAVIDDDFFNAGGAVPLAFARGGPFGTNLYLIDPNGQLLSVAPDGSFVVVGTGFPTSLGEIEFGPDGALYVASFAAGEVLRVASALEGWDASSGLLPDQVCPAWTLGDTAEPEDPLLSDGALVLGTDSPAELLFYGQTTPLLTVPNPLIIDASLRFVAGTSSAIRTIAGISFFDGTQGNDLFVGQDEIFLLTDATTRGAAASVDTDGAAHTYRIQMAATGAIQVLYDGALKLSGQAFPSATPAQINFGDVTDDPAVTGSAEWIHVQHNAATCSVSTTSTTVTSTTVVTTSSSTTTSTVPPACDGVPVGPTFRSLNCRIADLMVQVQAEAALGELRAKLEQKLGKAKERKEQAESFCLEPTLKKARSRLKQTVRAMIQFSHRLRTRAAKNKVPAEVREPLAATGDGIRDDAKALRGALICPDDAA